MTGWGWLPGADRAHFFRDGRSACRWWRLDRGERPVAWPLLPGDLCGNCWIALGR